MADPTLDRFASEYQRYHGLSEKRARQQRQEIERFAAFAGKASPLDCDAADLRAYLAMLVGQGLHVNTVRWRHRMLTPFFTWAFEGGEISGDTLMAIKLVKDPKGATGQTEPKPYTSKELRQFWKELDARLPLDDRFEFWLKRYREGRSKYKRIGDHVQRRQFEAIFGLALEAGLRSIEIFEAEIDHIHPDNATIVVPQRGERANGKDHYREVPFTSELRDTIHRWLELRARIGVKNDGPWIVGWINQTPRVALAEPGEKAFRNFPRCIGAWNYHRFRHTCATLWLRAGMKLEHVQRLLGHATLQQTLAYAEIIPDDIGQSAELNEATFRKLTRRDR